MVVGCWHRPWAVRVLPLFQALCRGLFLICCLQRFLLSLHCFVPFFSFRENPAPPHRHKNQRPAQSLSRLILGARWLPRP